MPSKSINHLAVWVSAIVFFIWGYVWYGIIFKSQIAAMGVTSPTSAVPYVIGFLMALVIGYGTAIALADSSKPTAAHGISFGLFMGIIFYGAPTLSQNQFAGQHVTGWLIGLGWALIGFALVGAIVGGWRGKTA